MSDDARDQLTGQESDIAEAHADTNESHMRTEARSKR